MCLGLITCCNETVRPPDHIQCIWCSRWNYSRWYSPGAISHGEGDGAERRETCTWRKYFSHKPRSKPPFPPSSSPLFGHGAAFRRTVPNASLHQMLPLSSSSRSEPLITPTVQTRCLYLIKEEWAALSNLSSETNTEPGSAFTGRALGMRWSKLGQCCRRCYQRKLRVSSKAAALSPFLEQHHRTGLSMHEFQAAWLQAAHWKKKSEGHKGSANWEKLFSRFGIYVFMWQETPPANYIAVSHTFSKQIINPKYKLLSWLSLPGIM